MLLHDKNITDMIASDLGNRVLRYPQLGSRKVSLSVMDNCLVRFDTSFEGVREDGDGSQVSNMVNWLTSTIPASGTASESLSSLSGK